MMSFSTFLEALEVLLNEGIENAGEPADHYVTRQSLKYAVFGIGFGFVTGPFAFWLFR